MPQKNSKKSEKERAKENVGAPKSNCRPGFGIEKKGGQISITS